MAPRKAKQDGAPSGQGQQQEGDQQQPEPERRRTSRATTQAASAKSSGRGAAQPEVDSDDEETEYVASEPDSEATESNDENEDPAAAGKKRKAQGRGQQKPKKGKKAAKQPNPAAQAAARPELVVKTTSRVSRPENMLQNMSHAWGIQKHVLITENHPLASQGVTTKQLETLGSRIVQQVGQQVTQQLQVQLASVMGGQQGIALPIMGLPQQMTGNDIQTAQEEIKNTVNNNVRLYGFYDPAEKAADLSKEVAQRIPHIAPAAVYAVSTEQCKQQSVQVMVGRGSLQICTNICRAG
jgi:hypothetical protein